MIFDTLGNPVGSFSVAEQTFFPEGITFNPNTDTLFIIGFLASPDNVLEYSKTGTLLNTFPLATTSTDGVAYDPIRNSYWIYDSDSDVVTHYDTSFSPIESFSGTAASGFGAGEGVAVIGDSLNVVAAFTGRIVEFDVADSSLIFTDGFEAGTTDAWSATVP